MSIIDVLQARYNEKRSLKTWGTPIVSPFFFDKWREKGILAALGYLVEREKTLGNPYIHPAIKAAMNLGGCCLLVIGIEKTKSPLKMLKGIMYALLFSSQGEGGPKEATDGGTGLRDEFSDPNGPCPRGGSHFLYESLDYDADACSKCKRVFPKRESDGSVHFNVPDVKECGCAWNESCMICRKD